MMRILVAILALLLVAAPVTAADPTIDVSPTAITVAGHEPGDIVRIRITNPRVRVYLGANAILPDGTFIWNAPDLTTGKYKVYSEHQVDGRWVTITSEQFTVA